MTNTADNKAIAHVPAPSEDELKELGFGKAAANVNAAKVLARKLRIAFEHFRIVKPENVGKFNEELRKKTQQRNGYNVTYDRLAFTPISQYGKAPPKDVLDEVRKAKSLGCFDDFEVATIESVRVVPDPIIFGVINGSANKYFVAQWDNDVKIEDILKEDEG